MTITREAPKQPLDPDDWNLFTKGARYELNNVLRALAADARACRMERAQELGDLADRLAARFVDDFDREFPA
jgi:hypothetical protein